jgi:2-phosphoglycerate kinase
MKQIILVGGMPTAGKSTLAENLSKQLNLPWISTDQIGTIMRAVASKEKYPKLFTWEDYDGVQFLNELTADEIADNEFANGEAIWLGVRKLIEEDDAWSNGFIIEGATILPRLIVRDFSDSSNVKAVFIGDHDIERVRNVVSTRNALWFNTPAYTKPLQEKDVEWALNFSQKLKSEVVKYGFAWVEVEKNEQDLAKVLEALNLST